MSTSLASKPAAAFHEAGHKVVGNLLGVTFQGARLSFDGTNWLGQCLAADTSRVEPGQLDRVTAIIALAGPLAEAKHLAECEHGPVHFSKMLPVDFLAVFVNEEANDHAQYKMNFCTESENREVTIWLDCNATSDDDIKVNGYARGSADFVRETYRSASDLLDAKWPDVATLATLLSQSPAGVIHQ